MKKFKIGDLVQTYLQPTITQYQVVGFRRDSDLYTPAVECLTLDGEKTVFIHEVILELVQDREAREDRSRESKAVGETIQQIRRQNSSAEAPYGDVSTLAEVAEKVNG